MERQAVLLSIIVALLCPISIAYKQDYGFGFMFKYEPNFKERQEAQDTLVGNIRSTLNHRNRAEQEGYGFLDDPLRIENVEMKFSGTKVSFENSQLYGLSQCKMENVEIDLAELKVSLKTSIAQLSILGNYKLTTWISTTEKAFNMSIEDAQVNLTAELMVGDNGTLEIREVQTDLVSGNLYMDFGKQNWFLGTMFQGLLNKAGNYVFDSIKPILVKKVEDRVIEVILAEMEDIPNQYPKSINPVDRNLALVRKMVKEVNLDPVHLADYSTQNMKWSQFELFNGQLHGLSTIRRTEPILLGFERSAIHMTVHVGVENLRGTYEWEWRAIRGVLSKRGQLSFNLKYLALELRLEQSPNLEKPIITSSNMTMGPTVFVSDGIGGAVDYFLEMIFNVAPNAFRQRVADAAEYKLSKTLEDELLKINIESLVEENQ